MELHYDCQCCHFPFHSFEILIMSLKNTHLFKRCTMLFLAEVCSLWVISRRCNQPKRHVTYKLKNVSFKYAAADEISNIHTHSRSLHSLYLEQLHVRVVPDWRIHISTNPAHHTHHSPLWANWNYMWERKIDHSSIKMCVLFTMRNAIFSFCADFEFQLYQCFYSQAFLLLYV